MSGLQCKNENQTKKYFWLDSYLTELKTTVSSVSSDEVTLKETIFYALSGGQESDEGTIGEYPVLLARKDGQQIFYKLPQDHHLKVGDEVHVKINWDRRYRLMRLHFAAEIVLELVTQKFPNIEKIGAHIAADKARIDFLWGQSLSLELPSFRESAMRIVTSNIPIQSEFSDEFNERRFWEIPGFARVPCGGTHLLWAGEIGEINLKRDNIGKGKERIVIKVNDRVPPAPSKPWKLSEP